MTDLTAITTPYGLLDDETREQLKAHGGPYEFAAWESEWRWLSINGASPLWSRANVYRVKPQPPKAREWRINVGDTEAGAFVLHKSRESADRGRRNGCGEIVGDIKIVHVREVLP
jgi:hypothetical protein